MGPSTKKDIREGGLSLDSFVLSDLGHLPPISLCDCWFTDHIKGIARKCSLVMSTETEVEWLLRTGPELNSNLGNNVVTSTLRGKYAIC